MPDDDNLGDRYYVGALAEAQQRAHEYINEARTRVDDPYQSQWPAGSPEAELLRNARTAVENYRRRLLPYRRTPDNEEDKDTLWTEPLRLSVRSGVSLDTVPKLFEMTGARSRPVQRMVVGRTDDVETESIYVAVPVNDLELIVQQLDDVCRELKFMPEREEGRRVVIDEELVKEATEYAKRIREAES